MADEVKAGEQTGGDTGNGDAPARRLRKSGSGRTPDKFKAALREMVSHDETLDALERVLTDPASPNWASAFRYATDRAYGKETDVLDGKVTLEVVRRTERPQG